MKQCYLFFFVSVLACFSAGGQRLVMPGDHADPSVVRIGNTFWASATTSNWLPAFPLYQSKDLVSWKAVGHMFDRVPSWADYYFWAPEISYDNGTVWVYYAAHKKGGNLCVGVARADKPEGPYTDLGPLVCQEVGSIDAFPMRDENGKLHLVWKEDGNSVNKPTPFWIQELKEDRTALLGEKKELFRNDKPWEGALVEGLSMLRRGDWFYAFYAAAGCCGEGCTYQSGVARARSLLGPWEKFGGNPVLANEGEWKCPGHGTPVEMDGRFYFLYHAYSKTGGVYTGRQGLLREFRFTPDGWIEFLAEPQAQAPLPPQEREDGFKSRKNGLPWEWSVFQKPVYEIKDGSLRLNALPQPAGAFLAQKTTTLNYNAQAHVVRRAAGAASGLALIGDEKASIGVYLRGNNVRVVQVKDGKETVLSTHNIGTGKKGILQMRVRNGKDVSFFYGQKESKLAPLHKKPIDGSYLPPWDRAPRVGLVAKGAPGEKAIFDAFELEDVIE